MKDILDPLANKAIDAKIKIENLESQITSAKKEYDNIVKNEIPQKMNEYGISAYVSKDGVSVKLVNKVYATLPKDEFKRGEAIAEIIACDGSGIIKNEVAVEFGKGETALATTLIELIKSIGLNPIQSSTVHPQTLAAFVRERLANGEEIDLEKIGAYIVSLAEIKL